MKTKIGLQFLEETEIEWMLASSFLDSVKDMFSSLVFLLGLGLAGLFYVLSLATSFGSALGISFLGAILVCICADTMSSWLRGWSPSWITLAVFRRNDKRFVVAKDRIGRKRIFMYADFWKEVNGSSPNDVLKIALDEAIRLNDQNRAMPFGTQNNIMPLHLLDTDYTCKH